MTKTEASTVAPRLRGGRPTRRAVLRTEPQRMPDGHLFEIPAGAVTKKRSTLKNARPIQKRPN